MPSLCLYSYGWNRTSPIKKEHSATPGFLAFGTPGVLSKHRIAREQQAFSLMASPMQVDAAPDSSKRKEECPQKKGPKEKKARLSLPEWAQTSEALHQHVTSLPEWKRKEVSLYVKLTQPRYPLGEREVQEIGALLCRTQCTDKEEFVGQGSVFVLVEHPDEGVTKAFVMPFVRFMADGYEAIWDTRKLATVWNPLRQKNLEHTDWVPLRIGTALSMIADARRVFLFPVEHPQ